MARRTPFLPQLPAEDLDVLLTEAVLDELPEVQPRAPPPFPLADAPGAYAGALPTELDLLLETLQAEAQLTLAAQFARVQEALAAHAAGLEARLAEADALVGELREENARLVHQNDLYERAFETLKGLTRDVEDAR